MTYLRFNAIVFRRGNDIFSYADVHQERELTRNATVTRVNSHGHLPLTLSILNTELQDKTPPFREN
mgnify:CR=1 FL=1